MDFFEASFNPNGLRVLVVDQNPTCRRLLSRMLSSSDYQVTQCPGPREALSLIRDTQSKFHMIISGLHFEFDMNGIEFLKIINGETDLPFVIVSVDDRKETIIECVNEGACAYLTKPVSINTIKNLWQHVARKDMLRFREEEIANVENMEPDSKGRGSGSGDASGETVCRTGTPPPPCGLMKSDFRSGLEHRCGEE